MKNNIELLAPAGSIESLFAAVQAGADAVYLGGSKFSARAYASNFDEIQMEKAVNYCHIYGVKVYVTVNTLLKEEELNEALNYVKFLYNIGVDALIIQDTGLAYLIRKHLPDFEIHASTQMTVHNLKGANLLKDLGFQRIVLSRELSLDEIKHISQNIETEIFVHGALCVCYSGQCLMSSIIGGRSGNRGTCAQPCRLPYVLNDESSSRKEKGYLLSPKDICTLDDIKNIINSGTHSLKIEGRMKRPEYVAGVISIYRKVIDRVCNGEIINSIDYENEVKKLLKLFNRQGFSKAYLHGNCGKDMMAYSYPKNTGIYIGKADKDLILKLQEDITIKDGIRTGDKGFVVSKILKDGKEVTKAIAGERVRLFPSNYRGNEQLFKTSDVELLNECEKIYEDYYRKKIGLDINLKFKIDNSMIIWAKIDGTTISVEGDIVQQALKKPLTLEKIKENLNKTGDTPFEFKNIDVEYYEEGFIPVSSINKIRRSFLNKLEEHILKKYKRKLSNEKISLQKEKHIVEKQRESQYIVNITKIEQLKAVKEMGIKNVSFNPYMRINEIDINKLKENNFNIYLRIPNIVREEFNQVNDYISDNLKNISGIVTANLGIISEFKDKTKIINDYKLNIFNSYSIDFYKDLLDENCLSIELNKKEIRDILSKSRRETQMFIYGRLELMISEYCAIGSTFGDKSTKNKCNGYCKNKNFYLTDRKNEKFPLITDRFCRSYVLNNVPLNLIHDIKELKDLGINSFRIDFVDENYDETLNILKSLLNEEFNYDFKNYTRGHYKRGVK